jgi:DNA-dependent RNA polymerase auxiliary subunit epsilon
MQHPINFQQYVILEAEINETTRQKLLSTKFNIQFRQTLENS